MKMKVMRTITVALVLGLTGMARGTIVDICAATNKPVYELGEEVVVFVIAYNPNPEPVTLTFGSALQRSYLMDGIYDWRTGHGWTLYPTQRTIDPYDSHTWQLTHGTYEMTIYPLGVGAHTVIGEVVGYGYSTPAEFDVIPEPATILLLAVGAVLLRPRDRTKSRPYKHTDKQNGYPIIKKVVANV